MYREIWKHTTISIAWRSTNAARVGCLFQTEEGTMGCLPFIVTEKMIRNGVGMQVGSGKSKGLNELVWISNSMLQTQNKH